MIIKAVQKNDSIWERLIEYANNCSWGAGKYLAKAMKENTFSDWQRVFVAIENDSIAGYCTFTKTDCIPNVTYTPYIGFMFVGEAYRGNRLSQKMILKALEYAKSLGFSQVYLVSSEYGLYEKYGFKKLVDAKDRWGKDEQIFVIKCN